MLWLSFSALSLSFSCKLLGERLGIFQSDVGSQSTDIPDIEVRFLSIVFGSIEDFLY